MLVIATVSGEVLWKIISKVAVFQLSIQLFVKEDLSYRGHISL